MSRKLLLLFFVAMLPVSVAMHAQSISLKLRNVPVSSAVTDIQKASGYSVVVKSDGLDLERKVTLSLKNASIESALRQVFAGQDVEIEMRDKNVSVSKKQTPVQSDNTKKGSSGFKVSGTITDENGEPLMGASVLVKGKKGLGVVADLDGKYEIETAADAVLEYSFIGYNTVEVPVGGRTDIVVSLTPDSQLLDDVVVVAYGVQKKVNLTGSVASLSSDVFENKPVVQASTALQGTIPGVTVTTGGGAPGADTGNIRIRGIGTFGGSSAAPLVLIDGVEGSLDSVDAAQIDRVSVLKDAASSAIYGSRAANGVILITTKRAEKGKSTVSYRGYVGWQTPTTTPDTVNPVEYMVLNREATENDGGTSIYTDQYIADYLKNNWLDPDNYPIVNWKQSVLQGNGLTHNHNLTLSASSGRMRTLTSIGFLSQNGIIKYTDFRRFNFRNNMNIDINDRLQLRFDMSGSWGIRNQSPYQGSFFNFMNARDPLFLAKWSNGTYAPFTGGTVNVLPMLEQGVGGNIRRDAIRWSGALALTWKPAKWLSLEGTVAPRFTISDVHNFEDLVTYYSDAYGSVSPIHNADYNSLNESHAFTFYGNYLFTAKAHKVFDKTHDLTFLLGASWEDMDQKTLSAYRQEFAYPQYHTIDAGGDNEFKDNGGAEYQWALASFFSRFNYNYKERYLFEANVRMDGSSRFAEGHRWGVFPSFSGAWRITEEPWLKGNRILDEMKIRASYGQLGNQNIGSDYYPTVQTLTISSISAAGIIYPIVGLNNLANEEITWETSEMYDMGIDASVLDSFTLTADWYYKTTYGILMQLEIPSSIGLTAPYQNAGTVRNIGWEAGVGYHGGKGDFNWSVDAHLSDVDNRIIDMNGTASGSLLRNQEGYAINSIYGLECIGMARTQEKADEINATCPQYGVETLPGDLIYKDIAGDFDEDGNSIPDGKIDDQDRKIIGSTVPRYTFGLNLNVGWRGFALSAQLQGVGKVNAYLNGYYTQPCVQGGTFRKEHLDRWTPETPDARFPRLSYASELNKKNSTFWMADASYCRLKNLQFSYRIPAGKLAKARISSLTLFANATNLFTLTRYWQGYDPENMFTTSAAGVQAGATASNYPLVATYTFGVDIKF